MEKKPKLEDVKYQALRDKKIIGMIILICSSIMQIFAFLKIPFLTSIHSFTIGMMFGNFNAFFYFFVAFIALQMIFPNKLKKPNWIKFNKIHYWIIVCSIILIVHAWIWEPKENIKLDFLGWEPWKYSMKKWWETYSSSNLTPVNYWGGVVGAFLWSLTTMLCTPIGSGIVGAILLIVSISILITGSGVGLYTNLIYKKRMELKAKETKTKNIEKISEEAEPIESVSELENNEEILPFEDPFTNWENKEEPKKEKFIKLDYSNILKEAPKKNEKKLLEDIKLNASKLQELFITFKIDAKITRTIVGPTLTKYIVTPGPGINLKKFAQLESNIKMSLAAKTIRMELPIPGESAIGVEVPNISPQMVSFKEVFDLLEKKYKNEPLTAALGKSISGGPLVIPINKTPHLLIAGATGSGKSVGINAILISIIMRMHPKDLRLVLIDPKMVEFIPYNDVPHLLNPVITDPLRASQALESLVEEMERRFQLMANNGVRNLEEYNDKNKSDKLPYIVIVIDELADLMNVASKLVETSIQRITQKARAAGIHLIVATQRPSVNVVTGTIKANIPSRISFSVTSSVDSKVILDAPGSEKLMGRGDMLISLYGQGIERAQGAYISNEEIQAIINKVKKIPRPEGIELFKKVKEEGEKDNEEE